jgi:hypothetical protein
MHIVISMEGVRGVRQCKYRNYVLKRKVSKNDAEMDIAAKY